MSSPHLSSSLHTHTRSFSNTHTHTQTTYRMHVVLSQMWDPVQTDKGNQVTVNPDCWMLNVTAPADVKSSQNTFRYSEQGIKQTPQTNIQTNKTKHLKVTYLIFTHVYLLTVCVSQATSKVDDSSPPLDFFLPSALPIHCAKWYIYIGHNLNHHARRLCWMCRQTFLQCGDADRGIMGAIDRNPRPRHPSNQTTPLQ